MRPTQYFDYLGSVWDQLSLKDKNLLAETWKGYEQIIASSYQQFAEANINIAVKDLLPFNTERWLPYLFSSANIINTPAVYTSSQDISLGVNLSGRYLLKLSFDNSAPIELDLRGALANKTLISEIVTKINTAFTFKFARTFYEGTVLQLVSPTSGPNSRVKVYETSDPSRNACEFILGLLQSELTATFPLYPYKYSLQYPRVHSIPELRSSIRDEDLEVLLTEGVDYIVENQKTISFALPPLSKMWAKRTLIDEETPFNNYGYLMDIYQPTSQRYVEVLQGLWFAFWTGPKPFNVKTSLYLLFGLPTAKDYGTVTNVTPTQISILYHTGISEDFSIPSGLVSMVSTGEIVSKYQPLVDGIEVYDKIDNPGFIKNEIGRDGIQRFLTESASIGPGEDTDETKALRMLEEYTFLPQISVDAFITPDINLSNVKIFLEAIKPLNKTFLFQVIVGNFRDPVDFLDRYEQNIEIDLTPNTEVNETTYQSQAILDDYEANANDGLNLDPHGILFQEEVIVEVYQSAMLIETFTL